MSRVVWYGVLLFSWGVDSAYAAGTPVAIDLNASTDEDTALPVVLSGTAASGGLLTYTVDTASAGTTGSVSCTGRRCTYTPRAHWSGTDRFLFRVTEGGVNSDWAEVVVVVNSVNDVPVAHAQSGLTVREDTARPFTLTASDVEGSRLTYSIVSTPAKGTATVSGSTVMYTPTSNRTGGDSFTFRAYDGTSYSSAATVSLTITPVNDRPTVSNQAVVVDEDTPVSFSLSASDVDGDALTPNFGGVVASGSGYSTLAAGHGFFTVSGTRVTYTPRADYHGSDSFTFSVSDGTLRSTTATVTIEVASVNDVPLASDMYTRAANGRPAHVVLAGDDVDGDTLSYSIVSSPRRGSAVLWNGNRVVYTSRSPRVGSTDTFTYRVFDGTDYSATRTVTVDTSPRTVPFPLDELPVDDSIPSSWTADGNLVWQLPGAGEGCEKSHSAHPRFEAELAGVSVGEVAVVAGHYDTLSCGYPSYDDAYSSIYVVGTDGTEDGFELRLLDVGHNVEASGVALDDGSLLFSKVGGADLGGGLLRYTPGSTTSDTVVTRTVTNPLKAASDSSPLYDPTSGTAILLSAVVPEPCGDAEDNQCGAIAMVDAGGRVFDYLDENDAHHAWGSGGCVEFDGYRFCGFGPGADAYGADNLDDGACTIVRLDGVPVPPSSSGVVSDTLRVGAVFDPGDVGCTPVGTLESSIPNGGLVTDGSYLYAVAYGSDQEDDYTRVYQLDSDLDVLQTFEIASSHDHSFTNGFHNSLLVSSAGNLYITGIVDTGPNQSYAVVEIDTVTGSVDYLVSEIVSHSNTYGTGHLYVDRYGDEVIAYAVGGTGVVTRLSDGAQLASYTLGESTGDYVAAPILIDDGDLVGDALMFVSADNVVTIVPDTGLSYDDDAPWPGPRGGGRMQGRLH